MSYFLSTRCQLAVDNPVLIRVNNFTKHSTSSELIVVQQFDPFGFLNPADGTDRLSRNVGKKLSLLAA
jgi:hypothetical protein